MSRPVPDDSWLTQYGKDYRTDGGETEFRRRPRFDIGETDLSVLIGRLSVDAATLRVRRRKRNVSDAVRYCQVAALTQLGFIVEATPTKMIPEHGSVRIRRAGVWRDDEAMMFDRCWEGP